MRLLFRFPRFNAKGAGLLSRIRKVIDQHSKLLENFDADGGISIRKNASGGLTFSGRGGDSTATGSISASIFATQSGTTISCTGGNWTHQYTNFGVDPQDFWFGAPGSIPAGAVQLVAGANYGYVEYDGTTASWGVSAVYPVPTTTNLRRCVFLINLTASGGAYAVETPLVCHNAGDIFTW